MAAELDELVIGRSRQLGNGAVVQVAVDVAARVQRAAGDEVAVLAHDDAVGVKLHLQRRVAGRRPEVAMEAASRLHRHCGRQRRNAQLGQQHVKVAVGLEPDEPGRAEHDDGVALPGSREVVRSGRVVARRQRLRTFPRQPRRRRCISSRRRRRARPSTRTRSRAADRCGRIHGGARRGADRPRLVGDGVVALGLGVASRKWCVVRLRLDAEGVAGALLPDVVGPTNNHDRAADLR